jgi:LysM repeat protein
VTLEAPAPGLADDRPGVPAIRDICPYLLGPEDRSRSAHPLRHQRCGAVPPPVPLALEKQRSLCLGTRHQSCATFQAARDQRASIGDTAEGSGESAEGPVSAAFWPFVRTSPVLLESTHGPWMSLPRGRGQTGQLLLVGLMIVAFAALLIARGVTPALDPGSGSPSATAAATVASASPAAPSPTGSSSSPLPSDEPTATPAVPSATPSASATPQPSATAGPDVRRYTVRLGDTLTGIAARFGTTVTAIAELNGITDPSLIRVGQVLLIP